MKIYKPLVFNRVAYGKVDLPLELREYVLEGTTRPVGCVAEIVKHFTETEKFIFMDKTGKTIEQEFTR